MKAWALLLAFSLISFLPSIVACAEKQEDSSGKSELRAPVDMIGIWHVWDDARSELVTFGSYQRREDSTAPLVRIYNVLSGEKRSIDVFKDFPNALFISVDGFAVGPHGQIVLACGIGQNTHDFTSDRILVYDGNSALIRNLRAESYEVGAVAMDEDENIYVLGLREYENSSDEAYPLILKYDSYGKITQEMLPRSLFSRYFEPTEGHTGDSALFPSVVGSNALLSVNRKEIDVYMPAAGALIALDHSGNIQRRVDAADSLSEFARTRGYKHLQVNSNYLSPTGDLWLEGFVSEPLEGPPTSTTYTRFLVRVTAAGKLDAVDEHTVRDPKSAFPFRRLIGFTQSNKPVAFLGSYKAATVLIEKNPF